MQTQQRVQKNGKGDVRYFWNVTTVEASGERSTGVYRSRSPDASAVKKVFEKNGQKVARVRAAKTLKKQ